VATEIKLIALAPSMTEGNVAQWLRKEGDRVEAGDIVAEIETDKAIVELEAPAAGVLGRIAIPAGSNGVKVDTVIGWIVQPGEAVPDGAAPAASAPAAAPAAAAGPAASAPGASAPAPVAPARTDGGRVFASPLARRLSQEAGVPLEGLQGSGPHGRIVRVDVEAAQRAAQAQPRAQVSAGGSAAAAPVPGSNYTDVPHSNVRRVIAQRLTEAKQQVPHFYLTIDCRIDRLLALRSEANAALDVKLSVNDFIVRAVALALRKVPAANASWQETAIRQWHDVDVSVAVATPSGLITPVVRGADRKTVGAISAEVKALAERARQGRLQPNEYQGGGFTISNLGMYGIREFAAIINPPQACILAVGAGEQRPVVIDGALAVATVMTCTLSADHRVVDGAVGAEFLAAFRRLIEQPFALLV